ncbi:MAG: response regulator transcription factor [Candidatus Solibacter usitatus]|nr:response regulator transcription factor [Candidatus Solibacter usitatus]
MARKILIAEDHLACRQGIRTLLSEELPTYEFHFATTHRELTAELRMGHWELVMLDLSLPGASGLDDIKKIKIMSPRTYVLVYTICPEAQLGLRALRAGADGYLTKDRPMEELFLAVHRVLSGKRYISATLAERLAMTLAFPQEKEVHELLSDREYQILRMLGNGLSPTAIGGQLQLSVKTVSTYRTRVLEKLNLQTTAELIRYSIEHSIS